jgi:hypothetical protein
LLSLEKLKPEDETDALALALLVRAAHFAPGEPIPRELLLKTVARAILRLPSNTTSGVGDLEVSIGTGSSQHEDRAGEPGVTRESEGREGKAESDTRRVEGSAGAAF